MRPKSRISRTTIKTLDDVSVASILLCSLISTPFSMHGPRMPVRSKVVVNFEEESVSLHSDFIGQVNDYRGLEWFAE